MITKLRFIEAGAANHYQKTWKNRFLYNAHICNPSTGLITLATIAKQLVDDTLMYSEAISEINWEDIQDANVVFISINTFNAQRGYEIARAVRAMTATSGSPTGAAVSYSASPAASRPLVVLGGMHATLNYPEAVKYADYVLLGDADESIVEFIQALQAIQPGARQNLPEPCAPPPQVRDARWPDDAPLLSSPITYDAAWSADGPPVRIPGMAYLQLDDDDKPQVILTASRPQPGDIDTIPNRNLVYDYARMAKRYDTLWAQVHASRGCTGTCDYCCVIAHFGRRIRTRSPQAVVEDIRQAVAFHSRSFPPRLNRAVWLTDDNFPLNRSWAKQVLQAIIDSELSCPITVQASWQLGFDHEMLALMKRANFFEVSLGIEFIDDASFVQYHKRCTRQRVEQAIANIQAHGIGVRGLFIMGGDQDVLGVGERLGQFVIDNNIHGCLIQSMFFVPGTPVYQQNKDNLLHQDWDLYNGNVVHRPKNMTPAQLQQEMIDASRKAYSLRRLAHSLLHAKGVFKVLALGETVWHRHLRSQWRGQLAQLRQYDS